MMLRNNQPPKNGDNMMQTSKSINMARDAESKDRDAKSQVCDYETNSLSMSINGSSANPGSSNCVDYQDHHVSNVSREISRSPTKVHGCVEKENSVDNDIISSEKGGSTDIMKSCTEMDVSVSIPNSPAEKEISAVNVGSSADNVAVDNSAVIVNSSADNDCSAVIVNSSADKDSCAAIVNHSADKDSSAVIMNSSADTNSFSVILNSSADKDSSAVIVNSSADKDSSAVIVNSSADKDSSAVIVNSSADKDSSAVIMNSSADTNSFSVILNSSADKDCSAVIVNSSADKDSSAVIVNRSIDKDSPAVIMNSSADKDSSAVILNRSADKDSSAVIVNSSAEEENAAVIVNSFSDNCSSVENVTSSAEKDSIAVNIKSFTGDQENIKVIVNNSPLCRSNSTNSASDENNCSLLKTRSSLNVYPDRNETCSPAVNVSSYSSNTNTPELALSSKQEHIDCTGNCVIGKITTTKSNFSHNESENTLKNETASDVRDSYSDYDPNNPSEISAVKKTISGDCDSILLPQCWTHANTKDDANILSHSGSINESTQSLKKNDETEDLSRKRKPRKSRPMRVIQVEQESADVDSDDPYREMNELDLEGCVNSWKIRAQVDHIVNSTDFRSLSNPDQVTLIKSEPKMAKPYINDSVVDVKKIFECSSCACKFSKEDDLRRHTQSSHVKVGTQVQGVKGRVGVGEGSSKAKTGRMTVRQRLEYIKALKQDAMLNTTALNSSSTGIGIVLNSSSGTESRQSGNTLSAIPCVNVGVGVNMLQSVPSGTANMTIPTLTAQASTGTSYATRKPTVRELLNQANSPTRGQHKLKNQVTVIQHGSSLASTGYNGLPAKPASSTVAMEMMLGRDAVAARNRDGGAPPVSMVTAAGFIKLSSQNGQESSNQNLTMDRIKSEPHDSGYDTISHHGKIPGNSFLGNNNMDLATGSSPMATKKDLISDFEHEIDSSNLVVRGKPPTIADLLKRKIDGAKTRSVGQREDVTDRYQNCHAARYNLRERRPGQWTLLTNSERETDDGDIDATGKNVDPQPLPAVKEDLLQSLSLLPSNVTLTTIAPLQPFMSVSNYTKNEEVTDDEPVMKKMKEEPEAEAKKIETGHTLSLKTYSCKFCTFNTTSPYYISRHVKQDHNLSHNCLYCSYTHPDLNELEWHMLRTHRVSYKREKQNRGYDVKEISGDDANRKDIVDYSADNHEACGETKDVDFSPVIVNVASLSTSQKLSESSSSAALAPPSGQSVNQEFKEHQGNKVCEDLPYIPLSSLAERYVMQDGHNSVADSYVPSIAVKEEAVETDRVYQAGNEMHARSEEFHYRTLGGAAYQVVESGKNEALDLRSSHKADGKSDRSSGNPIMKNMLMKKKRLFSETEEDENEFNAESVNQGMAQFPVTVMHDGKQWKYQCEVCREVIDSQSDLTQHVQAHYDAEKRSKSIASQVGSNLSCSNTSGLTDNNTEWYTKIGAKRLSMSQTLKSESGCRDLPEGGADKKCDPQTDVPTEISTQTSTPGVDIQNYSSNLLVTGTLTRAGTGIETRPGAEAGTGTRTSTRATIVTGTGIESVSGAGVSGVAPLSPQQQSETIPLQGIAVMNIDPSVMAATSIGTGSSTAQYQCPVCYEETASVKELAAHMEEHYKNVVPWKCKHSCKMCPEQTMTQQALFQHMKTAHNAQYSCTWCSFKHPDMNEVMWHMRRHERENRSRQPRHPQQKLKR